MSVLNLSCSTSTDTDLFLVQVDNDSMIATKNGKVTNNVNISSSWEAEHVISYTLTLNKNEVVSIDLSDITPNIDGAIMMMIKVKNKFFTEKKIENDKMFYSIDSAQSIPLGQLTILSGTSENRISGKFHIYNGTPDLLNSTASNGVYDATVEILIAA